MAEEGAPELVANTVAKRVKELRKERKWKQQDLANAMTAKGYPTDRSTVVRLETRKRGISVDDLVAVAAALNVSPGWLLLDAEAGAGETEVAVVGNVRAPAWAAWQWVEGISPLPSREAQNDDDYGHDGWNTLSEIEEFQVGRPAEIRRRQQHSASRAARDLVRRVDRVLLDTSKPQRVETARRAISRVAAELDDLEASEPEDRRS